MTSEHVRDLYRGDRGRPRREPLGRNDAMVAVCDACATEPAVARFGPERGYEHDGSITNFGKELQAANKRVLIGGRWKGEFVTSLRAARPGYIVIRVPRRDEHGRSIDSIEARATFAHELWASTVRILGSEHEWFLFERPDPKILARYRDAHVDPIALLERFRA